MNKFEQLLDFIVNEEKDKAEELFHAIVVEKSRDIYEQLIAEETQEDESVEEETDDETVAEEESVEEAFGMDGEEEPAFPGGDSADGLPDETEAPTAHDDEVGDEEGGDETAPATKGDVQDLEDALEDLKAEFERLMSGDEGGEESEEEPTDGEEAPEFGDEEEDEEEESAMPFEGRQVTREYRETIGKPYGSGNGISNKNEAGDGKPGPVNQNPKDRPTTGATAKNITQGGTGTEGIKGGEGLVGGVKGEFTKGVEKNISSSSKSSMKSGSETTKNPAGHGAEKKGSGESASNTKSIVDRKIG